MDSILQSLYNMTFAEVFAVLTGLGYIFFAARGHILCWLFGIISSLLWAYAAFFHFQLYADFILQIIYVLAGIYGWITWKKNLKSGVIISISSMTRVNHAMVILSGTALSIVVAWFLKSYTDAAMPELDAATTVFSLLTTWLIITRKIENWIYWIVIDLTYIYLYTVRGGYLFAGLFVVYTIIAVAGYLQWRKLMKDQAVDLIEMKQSDPKIKY